MQRWDEGIVLLLKSPEDFRNLRRAREFTQASLAKAVGCSRPTVGNLETGALAGVSPDVATALAWRLGVPLDGLFVVPDDARITVRPRSQRRRRRRSPG